MLTMHFWAFFFERNVDGIAYLRMFNEFVFPQLAEHFNNQHWEGRFRGLWRAQDGAPAHRLIAVKADFHSVQNVARSIFSERFLLKCVKSTTANEICSA